jgi:hypothetical protein
MYTTSQESGSLLELAVGQRTRSLENPDTSSMQSTASPDRLFGICELA